MNWRELLYRDYSANFGGGKSYDAARQWASYDVVYAARLPANEQLKIADLGCGKGEWLQWMGQRGFVDRTGVDLSESDLAVARMNDATVKWVDGNLMEFLRSRSGEFDIVHAKDVVEHFTKEEFIEFLVLCEKALRPGGQLWLLTYNAQSPLAGMTRYGDFTHEIGLTPASMAQCLRACGFSKVKVDGFHYCSRSLGGRLRDWIGRLFYFAGRFALKVRHGGAEAMDGVDQYNAQPDLFAISVKV